MTSVKRAKDVPKMMAFIIRNRMWFSQTGFQQADLKLLR